MYSSWRITLHILTISSNRQKLLWTTVFQNSVRIAIFYFCKNIYKISFYFSKTESQFLTICKIPFYEKLFLVVLSLFMKHASKIRFFQSFRTFSFYEIELLNYFLKCPTIFRVSSKFLVNSFTTGFFFGFEIILINFDICDLSRAKVPRFGFATAGLYYSQQFFCFATIYNQNERTQFCMYNQSARTLYCKKVIQICINYKRANKAIICKQEGNRYETVKLVRNMNSVLRLLVLFRENIFHYVFWAVFLLVKWILNKHNGNCLQ